MMVQVLCDRSDQLSHIWKAAAADAFVGQLVKSNGQIKLYELLS